MEMMPDAEIDAEIDGMQAGFVGCNDDPEHMHMIMMMGASPGPLKRERRTAS